MQFIGSKTFKGESSGAKAAQLHALKLCGYNVPDGFVVENRNEASAITADHIASIGGFPVAVRSNSLIEDSDHASYAGQFSSFLNIENYEDLQQAISACFDSINTAPTYQGQKLCEASMQVFVQRMVSAKFAGVCFSICPVSGEELLQVEFVEGLADELVSGKKTPHSLLLDYLGIAIHNPTLTTQDQTFWQQFAATILRIQAHFGRPQDIEWAYDGQELYILQSRPITIVPSPKTEHIYTTADFREGGLGTAACTPMLFSLYNKVFDASLKAYFVAIGLGDRVFLKTPLLKQYAARGYWNVSAIKRLLKMLPGFDEKSFDEDLGIHCTYQQSTKTPLSFRGIIKSIPVLIRLYINFYKVLKAESRWVAEFETSERAIKSQLQNLGTNVKQPNDVSGCFAAWLAWHETTEHRYFTTIYNSTNSKVEFEKQLNKLRIQIPDISANKLTQNLGNVGHVALKRTFDDLVYRCRENRLTSSTCAEFLNEFYYAADAELDLRIPRWAEDPASFLTMIKKFASAPEQQRALPISDVYQDEQQRISNSLGFLRRIFFNWHLRRTRRFLVMRERLRIHSAKVYALGRRVLLEMGHQLHEQGQLNQAQDIFYCFFDEVEDQNIKISMIEARKIYVDGFRNFTPPEEFGGGVLPSELAASVAALRGVGCSSGLVEGRIRIIHSPSEFERLLPGDLLVTKFTDPGWTPLLGRASGVITEVGGLLCHAAIICRELGIPAVVNVKHLLDKVSEGQIARINGDTGAIEILS